MATFLKYYHTISNRVSIPPKYVLLGMFACFFTIFAQATHNRAGEITYTHEPIDGQDFRYEFTFTTYTNTLGANTVDRDSLEIDWGDGTTSVIARVNGVPSPNGVPNGEGIGNNVKKNLYTTIHVFPGFAPFYVVAMSDPNRNNGIININNGVSDNIKFYLEDTLFILNPQFYGFNNSPILGLPPIDFAQVGEPYIHNPTAFDPDGDSLVFELIVPLALQGTPVSDYVFPNEVDPGPNNTISLNPQTGEFIWDSPTKVEEYNIAFLITEYRAGLKIGTMIRDMQVFVRQTGNTPPDLDAINDTCLWLGETLELSFAATDDDDPPQDIELSAFGLPFELEDSSVVFEAFSGPNEASANFTWETNCTHIFSDDYTIVVRAEDNFLFNNTPTPLTDLETWQLTVVAPPPTGLTAATTAGEIVLSWDDPYECASYEKFIGFSVWRSIGCDSIEFDKCQRGLDGTSYTRIANEVQAYTYVDQSAVKGLEYAYRVVAEFSDANNNQGFPINIAESHPSNNTCAFLPADLPIITHATVQTTDVNNGTIEVRWVKPNPTVLDTIVNIPPYTYEVYRANGRNGTNFTKLTELVYNSFAAANDTVFLDTGLNTVQQDYNYKIRFLASGDDNLGDTETASSVFVNIVASSEQLELSWDEQVPWVNQEYIVYRADDLNATFDSIGVTTEQNYVDQNLVNGEDYCYYLTSVGTYFSSNLPNPLLNNSQVLCGIPIDTVPPCPPQLTVNNACDSLSVLEDFTINFLSWVSPESVCGDDDVSYFKIYYKSPESENFVLIDTVNLSVIDYQHEVISSLAGCYYITAVDVFENESKNSNEICKESCLKYDLPNTFTPGNDQQNDLFVPLAGFRFVSSIDFQAFNRWGNLVYETNEPAINWDGTDIKTGDELPEAVYYYTCKVFEQDFNGNEILQKELSGYIHLFRKIE